VERLRAGRWWGKGYMGEMRLKMKAEEEVVRVKEGTIGGEDGPRLGGDGGL